MGRPFSGLWFATAAANLGDGVVLFTLPLLALAAGASDGLVALVTTLATLAWPVLGIHGGWLVDRLSAKRVLFWANLIRGLYLVSLAVVMLLGALPFWVVAMAAVLYGVAEVLVDTSLVSAVPSTVRPEHRGPANARIEATITISNEFAGAPLAGALIAVGHVLAVGTGGVLYLLALAGVGFMRRVSEPAHVDEPDHRVRAGMSFLWKNLTLRWLTLINAGMNLVWGMFFAVMVLYVVAPGPLGQSPFTYGLLFTGMAVGGFLASVSYGWLRRRVSVAVLLFADTIGTLVLVVAPALGGNYWVVLGAGFCAAAASSIWRILNSGIRQHLVPEYLLGRVYSASRVISWGALPIGSALAGVLVTVGGLPAVFITASCIAGVVIVAFGVLALRHPLSDADGHGMARV
ncbi:MAG: MFS transporter [Microbacteriaceae bacterium]